MTETGSEDWTPGWVIEFPAPWWARHYEFIYVVVAIPEVSGVKYPDRGEVLAKAPWQWLAVLWWHWYCFVIVRKWHRLKAAPSLRWEIAVSVAE